VLEGAYRPSPVSEGYGVAVAQWKDPRGKIPFTMARARMREEPSTGSPRSDDDEERRPIEGWRRLGVVVAIVAVWEAIAAGLWLWADLAGIAILAAVVGPVATIVALLRD
jgi:hypothetical protein